MRLLQLEVAGRPCSDAGIFGVYVDFTALVKFKAKGLLVQPSFDILDGRIPQDLVDGPSINISSQRCDPDSSRWVHVSRLERVKLRKRKGWQLAS